MAKQVPSAGKWEAGGAKVILAPMPSYAAPSPVSSTNPIPGLKKDPPKNSIAALKKWRFDFYTRPTDLFLNTCLDRFPQEKNFPNTDVRRSRNSTGNMPLSDD